MGMIIRLVKSPKNLNPVVNNPQIDMAKLLENYEEKLHLVADFYKRQEHYDELEKEIQKNYPEATQLASIVSKLQEMNK